MPRGDTGDLIADEAPRRAGDEPLHPFFFDVDELPGASIADLVGDSENAAVMFDLFGRTLSTKRIVETPELSVYHETAQPGERVKPHRHGTQQLNYVLRGELNYGNHRLIAGMGAFTPDTLYAWRAGDEGAEWIEIHAGAPGIFVARPGS